MALNILLISADQHRADFLRCYGNSQINTPHLDALARDGMLFENAYSECPICKPARTSIITGLQAHHFGLARYDENLTLPLARDRLLASQLTQAGYQTELIGKTHWYLPNDHRGGFEHVTRLGRLADARRHLTGRSASTHGIGFNELTPGLSHLPPGLHSTDWLVDQAIQFLAERQTGQPFFLWVSLIDPHPPLVIHEPYFSMYTGHDVANPVMPEWICSQDYPRYLAAHREIFGTENITESSLRKARAVYMGMISNIDDQLGRLFGELQHQKLWDSTLIVYTADHGEHLGDYGDTHKASFLEPSTRIPMIWRLPGHQGTSHGRSQALVELSDLYPSFCQVAEVDVTHKISGRSLLPILKGEVNKVRDELHGELNGCHMLRNGDYKYLYFTDDGRDLLFDVSKSRLDESAIRDEPQKSEFRRRLIAHLTQENNPDVVDGTLKDKGLQHETLGKRRAFAYRYGWPSKFAL